MENNLIDRQAAINALDGNVIVISRKSAQAVIDYIRGCADKIRSLPSAQPELIEKAAYIRGFEQGRTQGMIDNLLERLPSAQPEPQWIPCSERLPEYGKEVLTVNKDGEYEINHVIDEEDSEWFFNGALAWMPLPEPYRGEEK